MRRGTGWNFNGEVIMEISQIISKKHSNNTKMALGILIGKCLFDELHKYQDQR